MITLNRYYPHVIYAHKRADNETVIINQANFILTCRTLTCVLARIAIGRRIDMYVTNETVL